MVTPNPILDSANAISSATVRGSTESTLSSIPLGVTGGGEVFVKTGPVAVATGSATSANQTTQITAEQAILAKLPTVGTAGAASANVLSVQGVASGTVLPVAPPTTAVTASASVVSASGSVTAGARYVDMLFSVDFDGTVLGVAVLGSALTGYSFPPIAEHTYAAIAYTRSAGSITIFKGV
jgi:hypothetical protein